MGAPLHKFHSTHMAVKHHVAARGWLAFVGLVIAIFSPPGDAMASGQIPQIAHLQMAQAQIIPAPNEEGNSADPNEVAPEEVPQPENDDAVISRDLEPLTEDSQEDATSQAPVSEILTDLSEIPFPARKMRELILEAARAGDVEKLRRYIGYGDDVTMLSLGGHDEDPIEFLKSLSGDPEGHEILAIMTEILEAPFTRIEQPDGSSIFVWPYFYAYPFDKLTPEQRVQLFRIITYGDYEEMAIFGSYIFYRLGITEEGRWQFFVAGD